MVLRPSLALGQRQRLGLTQEIRSSLHYLALAGLRLEQTLDDVLQSNLFLTVQNTHSAQEDADWMTNLATPGPQTLEAALRLMAAELFWQPRDRALAEKLIDEVSENGLLEVPIAHIAKDRRLDLASLKSIQDAFLAEGGLLADDLGQSLAAQARSKVEDGSWPADELPAILDLCGRLDAVARGDHDPDPAALARIKTLNPRPADTLDLEAAIILPPDLIVERKNDGWSVHLNPLTHRSYDLDHETIAALTPATQKRQDIAEPLKIARNTIRALKARGQTLIDLTAFLCEQQEAALQKGKGHLAPLTRSEAARSLNCHDSTISRAVAGKTVQTPQGLWAMSDFFTPEIDPQTGLSGAQLRAWLTETIASENKSTPISDAALSDAIATQGHHVARRTITKYRLRLGLPPARDRQRLYARVLRNPGLAMAAAGATKQNSAPLAQMTS